MTTDADIIEKYADLEIVSEDKGDYAGIARWVSEELNISFERVRSVMTNHWAGQGAG